MIQQGWSEQYQRMKRSHERLARIASGQLHSDSGEARDALFHFFQDAYHLKDWLLNDPEVSLRRRAIEDAVTEASDLAICADLANGSKHRVLDRPRTRGADGAAFESQSVTVHVSHAIPITDRVKVEIDGSEVEQLVGTSLDPVDDQSTGYVEYGWLVHADGEILSAVDLTNRVIVAWDLCLSRWGLHG